MNIIKNSDWHMQIREPLQPLNLARVDAIALHHMAHPTADIYEVERWHLNQGWRAFGYNYWVGFDGTIYEGRGLHMGAGVANQNDHIISIGFQGNYQSGIGIDVNTMSDAQFNAGVDIIRWIQKQVPAATRIGGHGEFMATACPGNCFPLSEMKTLKKRKEGAAVPKTVYSLNNVHVQVIDPWNFKIKSVDKRKKGIEYANYANAGFFAQNADGSTVPVGNLVIDGAIITDAKNQADWLNTARHKLTTIIIHNDNSAEMVQTDDMMTIPAVKYAVSGVPIIRGGYRVSTDEIKAEGYFGNECYWTWHGFLGIRAGRLVYVAAETDFDMMVYLLEVLGITDAIKLDGGGSFILHNGDFEVATAENRRIHTIITWEG